MELCRTVSSMVMVHISCSLIWPLSVFRESDGEKEWMKKEKGIMPGLNIAARLGRHRERGQSDL